MRSTFLLVLACVLNLLRRAHGGGVGPPPGPPSMSAGLRPVQAPNAGEDALPAPGFTVVHVAAPLIRCNLPGQAPHPRVRARTALSLLRRALERGIAEGADGIALTGSVISAPPPLRQCDKGASYYKHPDAAAALEEAKADYVLVRTLLEETGLPYAVTPGGEDCIEAFEEVFGLEPNASLLRSRGRLPSAEAERMRQVPRETPPEHASAEHDEPECDTPHDPTALSSQAIRDFKARLSLAKASPSAASTTSTGRLKGGGGDLEDAAAACCDGGAGGACGADGASVDGSNTAGHTNGHAWPAAATTEADAARNEAWLKLQGGEMGSFTSGQVF